MKFSTTASSISALIFLQFLSQNWTFVLNLSEASKGPTIWIENGAINAKHLSRRRHLLPCPTTESRPHIKEIPTWNEPNTAIMMRHSIKRASGYHTLTHTETERETFWANIWHQKNLLTVKLVIHTRKQNHTHKQTGALWHHKAETWGQNKIYVGLAGSVIKAINRAPQPKSKCECCSTLFSHDIRLTW